MWGPKMIAVLALLPFQGLAAPANPTVDISTPEQNFADAALNSLDKRRPVWKNITCGKGPYQDWAWAEPHVGMDIAKKIRTWKGFPKSGGRTCKDIFRDFKLQITISLCNDNKNEIQLQGYADIADAIERIIKRCTIRGSINGVVVSPDHFSGQQFAEGNWNIVARGLLEKESPYPY